MVIRSLLLAMVSMIGMVMVACQDDSALTPRICPQDDAGCGAVRVEPTSDANYVDCISNPSARPEDCLIKVAKSEADEAPDPFAACPTDNILKSGMSTLDVAVQARFPTAVAQITHC
jgi:hypothetical protein